MGKILIIDDDRDIKSLLGDVLKREGFTIIEATDTTHALSIVRNAAPDAVLLDLAPPGSQGIDLIDRIRDIDSHVPVIMMTDHSDVATAVEAIKRGAYDFTLKPPDFDRLLVTLRRAVERRRLEIEVDRFSAAFSSSLEQIFGKSSRMQTVISQISQVAQTNLSVVIQGETGTGKSYVANAIHAVSKRSRHSFVRVDMGLIPESLFESELFGYRKGAFTGADRNKAGYFEHANRGTIFIDEIENIPLHIQGKLLSVIDERRIYPLGSTTPVDIDVRILAATNKEIRKCVAAKAFREDLFFRLGEYVITMPPLRERIDDIPFLAHKFMLESSAELSRQISEITDDAIELLSRHNWPGNVRELKNIVRKAVLTAGSGIIDRSVIQPLLDDQPVSEVSATLSLKVAMRELERTKIREALAVTGGNKKRAAVLLEISYKNLHDKVKLYGL